MELNEKYVKEGGNDPLGILNVGVNNDALGLTLKNNDPLNLTPKPNTQPTAQEWYTPIFNWAKGRTGKYQLSPSGEFFWYYVDADDIMNFRNDGFFSYQKKDGNADVGHWQTKSNGNGFTIKEDNGDTFDTDTNTWIKGQNNASLRNQPSEVVIKPEEIANGTKLVKVGMKGDIVTQIQQLLIKNGLTNISKTGKPDGIFGSRTAQSVHDFQEKNGLNTDSIVGKNTWAKLNEEPSNNQTETKLDPNTGLPDNSLGLPKFNTDINRFNKYGVSQAQQDADLKNLKLNENMKLTDIITHIIEEQGTPMLNPNQILTPNANVKIPAAPMKPTVAPVASSGAASTPVQPDSLTDVAKGGYLRFGMKGNVVRDMQVLINSLNVPEIKIDTNGVFNQQTLDAVVKVQKMLGIKPKNGKYGIFGPITLGAINKAKSIGTNSVVNTNTNTQTLPKFDTSLDNYKKLGVSPEQQNADLKKLGINEDLIKKTIKKHLRSL
jgi:peptidoglycan hydrolase-like protein with peptidoglycan-binding domain